MNLNIIYQDDQILVLNKPPYLVVDKAETQKTGTLEDYLTEELKIDLPRGGIVHRLDKDTSGVIIVAKTQQVLENLQAQFKDRQTKKEYLALVHGILTGSGRVEGGIMRNPQAREKFIVSPEGKEAATGYQPVESRIMSQELREKIFEGFNKIQMRKLDRSNYGEFTLVRCFPETGRTHQIRVHLKHIGFPIVGDEKYGGRKTSRLDHRWCVRQFLHAAKLEIVHPESGEKISFEAPLPEDLTQALSNLEKV
jgi:23S rRNA pseudouridine1911/1915/1917 synthase